MTKDNNPEQAQNQDLNEKAEFQNSVTREFVENHTGTPNDNEPVNESAARCQMIRAALQGSILRLIQIP